MSSQPPVPRVWLGCESCYASGRLVGEWMDARDAGDATLDDVHRSLPGGPRPDCEEVAVLDTDDMPVSREMSAHAASRWAEVVDEVDEHLRRAFYAWVDAEGLVEPPDDVEGFTDSYAGSYDSFEQYATWWAEETDMMDRWPDDAVRYFDWSAWARDMAFDHVVASDSDGGVFVFRRT